MAKTSDNEARLAERQADRVEAAIVEAARVEAARINNLVYKFRNTQPIKRILDDVEFSGKGLTTRLRRYYATGD